MDTKTLTLKQVFDLGLRQALKRRGFRDQDLTRAKKNGVIPSGWFPHVVDELNKLGFAVNMEHFNWSKDPAENEASN